MTTVNIDLRTTNHLGVYETVKAIDLKFEGPYVSPGGFVVMPTEFTAPYNPRSEHDYVAVLELVPGTWTIAGLKTVVPESDTPVNLVDILKKEETDAEAPTVP